MQRAQCGSCAAHAKISLECCAPELCAVPGKHAPQLKRRELYDRGEQGHMQAKLQPVWMIQRGAMPVIGWEAISCVQKVSITMSRSARRI